MKKLFLQNRGARAHIPTRGMNDLENLQSNEATTLTVHEADNREHVEPDHLHCPITQVMFKDPVMLVSSGHTYERQAILRHLTLFNSDPVTNRNIKNNTIVINWVVRKSVEQWLDNHPAVIPSGWKDRCVSPPADHTILQEYVRYGIVPRINDIIRAGADVNAAGEVYGCAALHVCLKMTPSHKQEEVFKILLDNGSDVNSVGDYGYGLLHYCASDECIWDREYVTRVLISKGANVNIKNTFGYTPLSYCASYGNVEVARLLINAGADVHAQDKLGRTAIFPDLDAKTNDYMDILRIQLDAGANINSTDCYGMTPLHVCAKEGCCVDIAKGMVALGSNLNATDKEQNTVLHTCLKWGIHNEWAVSYVEFLTTEGCEVNARDINGFTPLDICAQNAYEYDVFDILIKAGADVNSKDNSGSTPLHKYSLFSNFTYDHDREEFLNLWGWGGCSRIVKNLIENGALVNEKDKKGRTPLHMCRNAESMTILLESGADINARTNKGETALHLCAERGDLLLVKSLIDAGANLSLKDMYGRTFLKM